MYPSSGYENDGSVLDTCHKCYSPIQSTELDGLCDSCAGIQPAVRTRWDFLNSQATIFRAAISKTPYAANREAYWERLKAIESEIQAVRTMALWHRVAIAAADGALWAMERGAADEAATYASQCVTACRKFQLAGGQPWE